jgi:NAD+ kinase
VRIGITANPNRTTAVAIAQRAAESLRGRAEVVVAGHLATVAPDLMHQPLEALQADVLVAIGGDGTFLYTLRRSGAPLLPVNAGTVGVLSEVDGKSERGLASALDRVLGGGYFLEERMKLSARAGTEVLPDVANEYVVHAGRVGKMGYFEISFDGRPAGRVRADGLIVATPTGSTAYALSSLGPVVDPAVEGIVLVAMAPFRVESRALVIHPLRRIGIRPLEGDGPSVVLPDGQEEHPLPAGQLITIHRAPRPATFVRLGSPFFESLRGKRILPWSDESAEPGGGSAAVSPRP